MRSRGILVTVLTLSVAAGFHEKLGKNEQITHALTRLTFGPRPGDVQALKKIGLDRWVDLQLHPERIPESAVLAAKLQPLDSTRMSSTELARAYPSRKLATVSKRDERAGLRVIANDLQEAKIYRAVFSERQLEEVLTDFWFNHFNVYLNKGADRYLVTSYERDAIRPHVLGNFRDLLLATAEHPAMLWYLDNWQSVAPQTAPRRRDNPKRKRGLNENYARELLELHTLGVDGGYTQQDIMDVARCFTGWTIRDPYAGASFHFADRMHDKGEKVVLGVTIPAGGGKEDALQVLDILVKHPSTARFLSKKLAQRFVADEPPVSIVNAMAATFQKTNGDLRAVMKTMLKSREFWSEGAYRSKVKSPFELVASSLRATGADVQSAFGLARKIAELGQPLYRKQEPTGYSNVSREWVNSAGLLGRMNFALALSQNELEGVRVDTSVFEGKPEDVARRLLLVEASRQTRDAMKLAAAEGKSPNVAAALILGSPEFQRR